MITMIELDGAASNLDESIKILNCTDVPRKHWIVKNKDRNEWMVALNVNQSDNRPAMHIRNDRVFLGVEQGIFVLDIKTGELICEISDVSFVQ